MTFTTPKTSPPNKVTPSSTVTVDDNELSVSAPSATESIPKKTTMTLDSSSRSHPEPQQPRLTLNRAVAATTVKNPRAHHSNQVVAASMATNNPPTLTGLLNGAAKTNHEQFFTSLLQGVSQAKQEMMLQAKQKKTKKRDALNNEDDLVGDDELSSLTATIKRRRLSLESAPVQKKKASALYGNETRRSSLQPRFGRSHNFLDLLWEESWLDPTTFRLENGNFQRGQLPFLPPRPVNAAAAAAPAVRRPPAADAAPVANPLPRTVSHEVMEDLASPNITEASGNTTNSTSSSNTNQENFGWFVPMEEDDEDVDGDDDQAAQGNGNRSDATMTDAYYSSSSYYSGGSTESLAFSASTAPKANAANHDAQVEWAKAADTIDDVLGDFF